MAKVKLRVMDNTSLNVEGTIYRAGDVFEIERDYTAKQWIGAGFVTEVKSRRKTSGRKTSGRKTSGKRTSRSRAPSGG